MVVGGPPHPVLIYSSAFEASVIRYLDETNKPVGPAPHQPRHQDVVPLRLSTWEKAALGANSQPLNLCMDRCFWGGAGALRRASVQRMLEEEAGVFSDGPRASDMKRSSK